MNLKELLVKLGILKAGANAGTYKNTSERTQVMGADEPVGVDSSSSDNS